MREASICPICDSVLDDFSSACKSCGNGPRTRSVHYFYESIKSELKNLNALCFTPENFIDYYNFKSAYVSDHSDSKTKQDIQNMPSFKSSSFDWIIANHVLEHIPDERAALNECLRVLTQKGVIQLTVPSPAFCPETKDWGFCDNKKYGHFRNYGYEFTSHILDLAPHANVLACVINDKLSDYKDTLYLISHSNTSLHSLACSLIPKGYICIPIYNHNPPTYANILHSSASSHPTFIACPICGSEINDDTENLTCSACGHGHRTRILQNIYKSIAELCIKYNFKPGKNDNFLLDFFNSSASDSNKETLIDWISSNHENHDFSQLKETFTSSFESLPINGVFQFTLPGISFLFDFDYEKQNRTTNLYGVEFIDSLKTYFIDYPLVAVVAKDPLNSDNLDVVFFAFKSHLICKDFCKLFHKGRHVLIPLYDVKKISKDISTKIECIYSKDAYSSESCTVPLKYLHVGVSEFALLILSNNQSISKESFFVKINYGDLGPQVGIIIAL